MLASLSDAAVPQEIVDTANALPGQDPLSKVGAYILTQISQVPRRHSSLEVFSGCRRLSAALGPGALTFDIEDDPLEDLRTTVGLLHASLLVLSLLPGALVWLAPPCTTWVSACNAIMQRSISDPLGNCFRQDVADANLVCLHVAYLMCLAHFHGCRVCVEQPLSSLLYRHPSIEIAVELLGCQRTCSWLGAGGAKTPKCVVLVHTLPAWSARVLQLPKSKNRRRRLHKRGPRWWVGRKSRMSASAHYPRHFCNAAALASRIADVEGQRAFAMLTALEAFTALYCCELAYLLIGFLAPDCVEYLLQQPEILGVVRVLLGFPRSLRGALTSLRGIALQDFTQQLGVVIRRRWTSLEAALADPGLIQLAKRVVVGRAKILALTGVV